jgi:hypothetical protein
MKLQHDSFRIRAMIALSACTFTACRNHSEAYADLERKLLVPADTVLRVEPESDDEVYAIGDFQLSDHGVFILDHIARRVVRIDLEDGSRRSIGHPGEAPGELLNPAGLVVTDGLVRVTDATNGLVCYDSSGQYLDAISCFVSNQPLNLRPAEGQGYLGLRSANCVDDNGELVAQISVGLYETGGQALVEYYTFSMPLDLEHFADSFHRAVTAVCYSADENNGNVYVAPRSIDRVTVYGYSSSGEIFFRLDEHVERIEKTQEEIESERLGLSGTPVLSRYANDVEIEPYRPQIASLGVDSLGNLWVETSATAWPSFVVLSQPDGDTIFLAEAPSLAAPGSSYDFRICSSGMIVSETAEDGSLSLYMMRLEDR